MVAPPKSSILIGFSIIFTIQFEVSRYPYFWKHPNIAAYIYIYISRNLQNILLQDPSLPVGIFQAAEKPVFPSTSMLGFSIKSFKPLLFGTFFWRSGKTTWEVWARFFCWPKMDDSIFWLSTEATGHLLTSSLLKQHLEWAGVMLVLLVLP